MSRLRYAFAVLGTIAGLGASGVQAQPLPPNHPPLSGLKTSEELLHQLEGAEGLKGRDKPFQVAASLGKLYYGNGRFEEGAVYLKEAVEKGEPVRALYLAERRKAQAKKLDLPNAETAGCVFAPTDSLEHQLGVATAKAKASQTAAAATCARLAYKTVSDVRLLYAGALFNTGDVGGAFAVLEGSLEATPDDPDVLWAHAHALYEHRGDDPKALAQVKAELSRYLTLRPHSPRAEWTKKVLSQVDAAIAAGGLGKLDAQKYQAAHAKAGLKAANAPALPQQRGLLPPVNPQAMEAITNAERTPELVEGLKKLVEEAEEHLARGRFGDALDNYKRVVPFEPQNGRAKAGMAWALVGLKRGPMADNVWNVAVQSDPKAVDDLGKSLMEKGDRAGALGVWQRLASTDPTYARTSGLTGRIQQ